MIEIFHFLKFEEFANDLGRTFSIGDDRMNPLGILQIPWNVWPKGPENIYF